MGFRRPCLRFCVFLLVAASLLSLSAASAFLEDVSQISPEVPLRLKQQSKCTKLGSNIFELPDSTRMCPCSLLLENTQTQTGDDEILVVRKEDFDAWKESGSEGDLFAEINFPVSTLNGTELRVENEGEHLLVVRSHTDEDACVNIKYMLATTKNSQCPVRLSGVSSRTNLPENGIISGSTDYGDMLKSFMVGVYSPGKGACTGTVVGKNWVITAAHCAPEANSTQLFVGGPFFSAGGQKLVTEVFIHPDYYAGIGPDGTITSAVVNDLALLRTFNEIKADPILLNNNEDIPQPRDIVRAAGYGLTYSEAHRGSLNIVDVSETPFDECNEAYREISAGEPLKGLTEKQHICAGPDDVCAGGVCRGDSGGPIMVRRGQKFVQVGITSFGLDCKYKAYAPDVFARVSLHSKWIEDVTQGEVITMNGAKLFDEGADSEDELNDRRLLRKRRRRNIGIGIAGALLIILLIAAVIACYCCTRNRMRTGK